VTTTVTTTEATAEPAPPAAVCPPAAAAGSPAGPFAVTGCKCGKVELKFFNYTPRMRLYCCCIDCNDAFRWAESQGGPPKRNPCSDSFYWHNDFEVVRGDEFIKFFLLNEGYMTTRLVTTCCYSTLVGDHPAYGGQGLIVYADYIKSCEYVPRMLMGAMGDLTKDQREWVEKFDLGPFSLEEDSVHNARYSTFEELLTDPAVQPLFESLAVPCPTTFGTTMAAMVAEKGVTTLDWKNSNPDARNFPEAMKANNEFIASRDPAVAERIAAEQAASA